MKGTMFGREMVLTLLSEPYREVREWWGVCPIDKNSPYILVVTADGGCKFVFGRLKKTTSVSFNLFSFPFIQPLWTSGFNMHLKAHI